MKKILFIAIISATAFSCKKKQDDPTPIIVKPIADSVHFDNKKLTGDTISTYKPMNFASISASLTVFQKNKLLPNESVEVFFKAIDKQGAFKINAIPFNSKIIKSNDVLNFDFYPTAAKGVQRIELTCTFNGKTFRDTLFFYVKPYQPVPFTVIYSSKNFLNQTPNSNISFNFQIKNGLTENSNYRYRTTQVISSTGNYGGTTLLKNTNTNTYLGHDYYNIQSNSVENLKIELTNNLSGTYMLPFEILDANNEMKRDTIVYIVK